MLKYFEVSTQTIVLNSFNKFRKNNFKNVLEILLTPK